jgi:2-hydroxychromene-2-carboxylate isomerase
MANGNKGNQTLRFLFDPACPWAYRASLWVREVAEVLPLKVSWEVFSLEYINRDKADQAYLERLGRNRQALRLLARARNIEGEAGIDALYLELGKAVHERKESLDDEAVLARALAALGLPLTLLAEAREDAELDDQLEKGYAKAIESGAFGVPTLYINGSETPLYGPLIATVPSGYEAAKLWEYTAGLAGLPYFYEIKRER